MKKILLSAIALVLTCAAVSAQRPQGGRERPDPVVGVKEVAHRVYNYLDSCTPYALGADGNFQRGDFWINCYEWGVTYSGMFLLYDATGEPAFLDYAYNRFNALGAVWTRFDRMRSPKWLDDCGAMCAAMCKAYVRNPKRSVEFRALLDNWFDFVMNKEYRLGDGILARNRPTHNSVWLDDMYMGITPIAYRGYLAESENDAYAKVCYEEVVKQILLFKKYLWVPEMNLYRHGWIESMEIHPDYHWARANGWAMLTMCDVLDVLPEDTPGRDEVLSLLKSLIAAVAPYQAPNGLWHQLINRTESYLETSASAMYVYCIAHAVNKGWVDKTAFQDVAKAGWHGVATEVNELGQVDHTCVGTGLGWTNTFYENRPANVRAAHGYGPVLLAAAEMIKLYENEKALAK